MAALFIATTPIGFDQTGITSFDTADIDPNGPVTGKVVLARGINAAPAGTLSFPSMSHIVTTANAQALQNNLGLTNGQRDAAVGLEFGRVIFQLVGAGRFTVKDARRWVRLGGINLFRLRDDGTWFACDLPYDRSFAEAQAHYLVMAAS